MANGDKPPGGAVIVQVTTEQKGGNVTETIKIDCKHASPSEVAQKAIEAVQAIKQQYEKED